MYNPVIQNMLSRSSVRDYLPYTVEDDKLQLLKTAALSAPTACDLQQTRFVFIENREILGRIESAVIEKARERGESDYLERLSQRGNKVLFGAPLFIIIAVKSGENYIDVDAGIAVQNLALAAEAIGLDSVIMAAPDRVFVGEGSEEFLQLAGIPAGWRFAIGIAVGYAAQSKAPHTFNYDNVTVLR